VLRHGGPFARTAAMQDSSPGCQFAKWIGSRVGDEMRGLACLSIALSPIFLSASLPKDAIVATYTEHAEILWSSRDGLLRSRHSAAPNHAAETGGRSPEPDRRCRPVAFARHIDLRTIPVIAPDQ